jgi:hypothetical protein
MVGDKGCEHLSQVQWPCLKKLKISRNHIGSGGIVYLARANWPLLQ